MDYLEGFFIGPIWGDTDYKNRRHFGSHIILSFLMLLLFIVAIIRPALLRPFIFVSYPSSLVFLILLVLLTPLFSSFYYRLPGAVRPLLILLYLFKYSLLFYVLLHFLLPLVPERIDNLSELVFERMDNHIAAAIEFFEFAGSLFGMILGIVAGGLWIVLEMLILVMALLVVPLLSLGLMKGTQYLLDFSYKKLIFDPVMEGRRRKRRTAGIRSSTIREKESISDTRFSRPLRVENAEDSEDLP